MTRGRWLRRVPRWAGLLALGLIAATAFGSGGGGAGGTYTGASRTSDTQTTLFTYCPGNGKVGFCYPAWQVSWWMWGYTRGILYSGGGFSQTYFDHGVIIQNYWDLPFRNELVVSWSSKVTHDVDWWPARIDTGINTPTWGCHDILAGARDLTACSKETAGEWWVNPFYRTDAAVAGSQHTYGFGNTSVGFTPLPW